MVGTEGEVKGHGVQGQLSALSYTCIRAFTLSLSNHTISAADFSSGAWGVPQSPSYRHSLVAEVQLLGVGIVVNEEAALNGVQVHLEAEARGP